MFRTGQIIDLYDDVSYSTFRSIFPTAGDIPYSVKTAEALTPHRRDELPDDLYALVLRKEGSALRKYACVDRGNTELNIYYFLKHGHALPPAVREKVAHNLNVASSWYRIEPEQLEKVAVLGMMGRIAGAAIKNPVGMGMKGLGVMGTISQVKQTGNEMRQGYGMSKQLGGTVMPTNEAKHMFGVPR